MSEDNSSSGAEDTTEESAEDNGSGQTILYCFTRQAMTASDLTTIRDALSDEGYEMIASDSGEKIKIVREESGSAVDVSDILNS